MFIHFFLRILSGFPYPQYKQWDVVNEAAQMRAPLSEKIYLALLNDNIMEPIEVAIKITTVQVTQTWSTRTVNKMNVSSHQEPYLR